MSQLTDMLKLG